MNWQDHRVKVSGKMVKAFKVTELVSRSVDVLLTPGGVLGSQWSNDGQKKGQGHIGSFYFSLRQNLMSHYINYVWQTEYIIFLPLSVDANIMWCSLLWLDYVTWQMFTTLTETSYEIFYLSYIPIHSELKSYATLRISQLTELHNSWCKYILILQNAQNVFICLLWPNPILL